jgi:hypothetical protein
MEITGRRIREAAQKYPQHEAVAFDEEEHHLGILPLSFREGSWTQDDLEWIIRWKSQRAAGYFDDNDPELVADTVAEAVEAQGPASKIDILRELRGVEVPMASAILVFMDPEAYTVLDERAWNTLNRAGFLEDSIPGHPKTADYLRYLGVCHSLSQELDISLRTLDRALWAIGIEH